MRFEMEPLKSPLEDEILLRIDDIFGHDTKDKFLFNKDACLLFGASDELITVLQIVAGDSYRCSVCRETHSLIREEKVS